MFIFILLLVVFFFQESQARVCHSLLDYRRHAAHERLAINARLECRLRCHLGGAEDSFFESQDEVVFSGVGLFHGDVDISGAPKLVRRRCFGDCFYLYVLGC